MPASNELRVHVDFNDLDAAGHIFVLPEDVDGGVLTQGLAVELVDEEGNQARGHVAELLELGQAQIAMVAGSWRGPAPVQSMSLQEQVTQLLVDSASRVRSSAGWYALSRVSSCVVAPASLPSGRPEPRSAVPSTM
jgi:hypothetical protein